MAIVEVKTKILPGGRIEVQAPGLVEGEEVTIRIVSGEDAPRSKKSLQEILGRLQGRPTYSRRRKKLNVTSGRNVIHGAIDPPGLGSRLHRLQLFESIGSRQIEPFASASAPLWEALQDQRMSGSSTSALTLLEVLVKPLRERNDYLINLLSRNLSDIFEGLESLDINQGVLRGRPPRFGPTGG